MIIQKHLWQYCKDIPAVNNNGNSFDFNGANATDSFNSKAKITGQTGDDGEIDNVEIMVHLKYLIVRAITVQYHYNTSNCERSMKLGTNVYQHILNFF